MRVTGITTAILILMAGGSSAAAQAADVPLMVRGRPMTPVVIGAPVAGVASSGPNCAPVATLPGWRGVWLGHFSGGNYPVSSPSGSLIDWRNDYACFPNRTSCQRWQRAMRVTFHRLEGYRTCLLIR